MNEIKMLQVIEYLQGNSSPSHLVILGKLKESCGITGLRPDNVSPDFFDFTNRAIASDSCALTWSGSADSAGKTNIILPVQRRRMPWR